MNLKTNNLYNRLDEIIYGGRFAEIQFIRKRVSENIGGLSIGYEIAWTLESMIIDALRCGNEI
jgi:hypothetical protein